MLTKMNLLQTGHYYFKEVKVEFFIHSSQKLCPQIKVIGLIKVYKHTAQSKFGGSNYLSISFL